MLKEFKEFAMKGNIVDMAVGIIMGTAFGAIVASLVNDIIMPPIGLLLGGVDFSQLSIVLKQASDTTEAVTINYGVFLNTIINFVIIAFAMFIMIKQINKLNKKDKPSKEEKSPTELEILTEIRDLLKRRK